MKNVLIVEDNDTTRKRLSKLVELVSVDANVFEFETTQGVYDFIFKHSIDLFLVDIVLDRNVRGDMSGIRLVEAIRTIPRYEFVPIIFISSLYDEAMYAYSQLHSYRYIEKPFDDEQVKSIIAGALRFPKVEREDRMLHFRMDGTFYTIKGSAVLYIENRNHKMYIHRDDGKEILVPYRPFSAMVEEIEGTCLIQCNRSVIVNSKYIEYIDWANDCLKLKNVKDAFRIGITFKRRIKEIMNDLQN